MEQVKAIIFDLGGVLLNVDYGRTRRAFIDLGIDHFDALYTQHHAGQLFTDFETGKVGVADFVAALKKEAGRPLSERQITDAWNAMLLDFPAERIRLLRRLKQKYRLFLLSNTNALHVEAFNRMLQQTHGLPFLDGLFDKAYYSHLIAARKPGLQAYERVIRESNLDPASTLFIDDTPGNIEGARRAGLQAILLSPPRTVTDIFPLL